MNEGFKVQFNLPRDGFEQPIDLTDTKIGFSVYKKGVKEGFKSLFRVYIKDKDLEKTENRKQIVVNAVYGREDGHGITISSTDMKRGLSWPIELISYDEYFYDINTKNFFYRNKQISAFSILKRANDLHYKPTKPIVGLFLRIKLYFWREFVTYIPLIFIWLLYLVSGDRIEKNIWTRVVEERTTKTQITKDFKEKDSKKLNIFGYQASQWAVMLYCIAHLAAYLIAKVCKIEWSIVIGIFANSFLIVMYVIPTLGFIDFLVPRIFKYLIKQTTDFAMGASSKKIKI